MTNNNTPQSGSQRTKTDKEKTRREQLAKYLYDVSKIFVAGMILVNITPLISGDFTWVNVVSFVFGILTAIPFAWIANRVLIY